MPAHVAVIGGGRWARVVTDVLCGVVAPSVDISVHSRSNAEAMSDWVQSRRLSDRVAVSAAPAVSLSRLPGAAIVVNAARDHESTVDELIRAGVPVLVEKPMALSAAAADRLASLAASRKVPLAPAHVFRFARYVDRFSVRVLDAGPPAHLRVWWTDPEVEIRYGEAKSHDVTLPIAADLIPHILSVLGDLVPDGPDVCRRVTQERNGSEVRLDATLGGVECDIVLARGSDARRRVVEAVVGAHLWRLDFSPEPGRIEGPAGAENADPDWALAPRPMARMLRAFLHCAAGGERDRRLDVGLGVRACRLIDQALAGPAGAR